jgi:hypothetical protein
METLVVFSMIVFTVSQGIHVVLVIIGLLAPCFFNMPGHLDTFFAGATFLCCVVSGIIMLLLLLHFWFVVAYYYSLYLLTGMWQCSGSWCSSLENLMIILFFDL